MTIHIHSISGLSFLSLLAVASQGCGDSSGKGGEGGATSQGTSTLNIGNSGTDQTDGNSGSVAYSLPEGFTPGKFGGYRLGEAVDDDVIENQPPENDAEGCGSTILGVVRDFKDDHPDFESYCCGVETGLVADELGEDKKPVYAPDGATEFSTGQEAFDDWYSADGEVFLIELSLEPNGDVFTFHSTGFFPLDDAGFGNQGRDHNFHFTTEIHTRFEYMGGETFTFTGDDDVFVFINGRLVIDIGGVHAAETATVDIDDAAKDLGLEVGETYDLDLFHAERRTSQSNFRIDTTLSLVDCGYVLPNTIR